MQIRFASQPDRNPLADSVYSGNGMGQHYTDPAHPVVRRAVKLANDTGAKDVLELATGRGLVAKALVDETGVSKVLATDINRDGLKELRAEAKGRSLSITARYFNAAGGALPKAWREKFDLVVAKDLYPFLNREQIARFLQNASAALKPGGWFLVSAPSTDSQLYRDATPAPQQGPQVRQLGETAKRFIQTTLDHFSFANPKSLKQELSDVGLQLTETQPYGRANGWFMAVAQKR